MFTFVSWDSMGELLSEIGMVLLLCVFLFVWAARVRSQEEQRRRAAAAPPAPPASLPPARAPEGVVSAVRPLVEGESERAPGNDRRS
jgi:hypothetical protein